ncbi:unnamed protein product [Lymnaea stagnalis]|uniref:Neurotransmitter-gated ion-channel ligand-binding domain-containing protein n=1 Tax=Lymnaea stagnalis TaxID=6523 RepID=A0AAV2I0U7_LYMST
MFRYRFAPWTRTRVSSTLRLRSDLTLLFRILLHCGAYTVATCALFNSDTSKVYTNMAAASIYPPGYSATVDDVAKLHSDLFSNYKRVIPPVYQQNHAVHVRLSLFLLMIHDLDMKNQVLTTSGWLNVNWEDEFLRWNKSDYGGVEEIIVSQSAVWLPDILVENTAQNFAEIGSDSILVSIKDDGHISWEPGILTKTICEVNIGKYPFDYQKCEIKFLTWMHTNKTLDVQPGSDFVSLDATISNGEWDIKSAIARPYFYPSTYKIGTGDPHGGQVHHRADEETDVLRAEHDHPGGDAVPAQRARLPAAGQLRGEDGARGHRPAVVHGLPQHHQRGHAQDIGEHFYLR